MRRIGMAVALLLTVAALGACGTIDRAVQGFETGPSGWTMTSETRTSPAWIESDATYVGASEDGLIFVRLADGRMQTWSTR